MKNEKPDIKIKIPKTSKWILLMIFVGGNVRRYNEPISGKIRLLKEIFLLKESANISEDVYEFKPYRFGPFSTTFLSDIDFLKFQMIYIKI